jgi:hypothetical protein
MQIDECQRIPVVFKMILTADPLDQLNWEDTLRPVTTQQTIATFESVEL